RPEHAQVRYVKLFPRHDAVWVADAQRHHSQVRAVDVERGQLVAEDGHAHGRGHRRAVDFDGHVATGRVDHELVRLHTATADQPAGEDADAVAALFGLRAVRVED